MKCGLVKMSSRCLCLYRRLEGQERRCPTHRGVQARRGQFRPFPQ